MDDHGPSSLALHRSSYNDTTWLPAALLATLVLLVTALQSFGGEPAPLQWRAAGTPSTKSAPSATNLPVQRLSAAKPDANGYAVMQVAYEEIESPSVSASGAASLRSVVVHPRDPKYGGPAISNHVAQNPFGDDDDEITRGIDLPFGQDPQQPDDMPEIDLDAGPLPEPPEPGAIEDMPEPTMPINGQDDLPTAPTRPDPVFRPGQTTPERDFDFSKMSPQQQANYNRERERSHENCEDARKRVFDDVISEIDLSIRQQGTEGEQYPFECVLDNGLVYEGRHWAEVTYMWKAAGNCHKPLYFEQVQLERYGHSWGPCVQPLVSGAHFFTRLPVLPYCMGITPPNECIYPLGHYRPGNCAPYMIPAVPFTWRAAAFQAGATVGTAAFLP